MPAPTQVAIGVGGRFHADHMARALGAAGLTVRLITTFPRSRFPGLAPHQVCPVLYPELRYRLVKRLGWETRGGAWKMAAFGRALARALETEPVPLAITWSSFGLEALRNKGRRIHAVVRDSSHIAHQVEVLAREYEKRGLRFPDHRVVVARETEEYERADAIVVLSDFARRTFVERGVSAKKIAVIPLGVDTSFFRPAPEPPEGGKLRVVYAGQLSLRKGIPYLLEATAPLSRELELHLVGPLDPELAPWLARFPHARLHGPLAHHRLSDFLRKSEVFAFPTLEDGFGQTLVQAMACGLVPVTTASCGAAELIRDGENGLVVPPADSEALREALLALLRDPDRRAGLRRRLPGTFRPWDAYGEEVRDWARRLLC